MTGRNFIQTHSDKPIKWRKNGMCKTYKRKGNAHKFSLPIKHGLYNYSYINDENAHLFELVD